MHATGRRAEGQASSLSRFNSFCWPSLSIVQNLSGPPRPQVQPQARGRALDDEGHKPGRDGGEGMPVEAAWAGDEPDHDVAADYEKRDGMGGEDPQPRQGGP